MATAFCAKFTVKYNECGSSGGITETNICYSCLTVVPSPFASTKLARQRGSPDELNVQAPQSPSTAKVLSSSIRDILAAGVSRGKKKGWRAKELGVLQLGSRDERFQSLLREDTKELLGFLSGLPANYHRQKQKGSNGQFVTSKKKNNACTISYLAKAWDVGRNLPKENIKKGRQQPAIVEVKTKRNPTQMSVIDSLDTAKLHFSARNLFIADLVEERTNEEKVFAYDTQTRAERFHFFREKSKVEWLLADANLRDYWEAMSQSKVARQPHIRDNIIEVMRANPAKSFEQIAHDIGNWCSVRTLARWISQHSGYATYVQRALPLLTAVQKQSVLPSQRGFGRTGIYLNKRFCGSTMMRNGFMGGFAGAMQKCVKFWALRRLTLTSTTSVTSTRQWQLHSLPMRLTRLLKIVGMA
jgi:hypothetical protein